MARRGSISGVLISWAVALAAIAAAAWLVAPDAWLAEVGLAATPEPETDGSGSGWGQAATPEPEPPLIDLSTLAWMAWTPETGAFFLFILACLATMTGIELGWPGGAPRRGVLGLETTRGDRLFITLLGSAWIMLGWLGLVGAPVWGGAALALGWAVFVFWKV